MVSQLLKMALSDCQRRLYHLSRHLPLRDVTAWPLSSSYSSTSHNGTLMYEDSLPCFPVPNLQQTLQKYLRQYQPHVTKEEFERVSKVVKKFAKPGGIGEQLQGRLLLRKEQTDNWLSDWWQEYYLKMREPNVLTTAPAFLSHPQDISGVDQQLDYASILLAGVVSISSSLARHEFPPVKVMGVPMSMDQYFKSLCSCRIPGVPMDTCCCYPVDTVNAPRHVIIVRNNHFFKFDVLDIHKTPLLSAAMIHKQLQRIVEASRVPGPAVGLLTSERRDTWAGVYAKMMQNEVNAHSLHDIQSSLGVVCLDETTKFTNEEEGTQYGARLVLCGGGSQQNSGNRWFDKTFQLFIGTNGEAGLYGDHSLVDGVLGHVFLQKVAEFINELGDWKAESVSSDLPHPEKLEFILDSEILDAIDVAGIHLDRLLDRYQIGLKSFTSFGKKQLKNLNLRPDGFIQIAIQMTFWRMFGYLPSVFEASSLQAFKLGRMEHIRTVTNESAEFIKAFHDKSYKPADKLTILHQALEVHRKMNMEAKSGQGMERHLFGLQRIAEENDIDASEFFEDPSWKRSNHIHLRTANIPGDLMKATFSPRMYQYQSAAMWYSIRDEHIQFSINTTEERTIFDVNSFLENLFISLTEMKDFVQNQS
ncbi:Carnitine O-acetyltransferase [Holothuria leucospilota]|uniref:Carnitine O-acetyltransferase n=1 Tax=Holothuria leucospilota TaxID=206669 RepID=A0A9Q1H2Q1_HOLLE|nr:Carnitine O-acetyltransferase [Holothuria leucospilota]